MIEVYLFDWGDTLMVDFPGVPGKMCDWEKVAAVPSAMEALENLSKHSKIYVATGAAESTESDIERVGLSQFISGYFCQSNIGSAKGSRIIANLRELHNSSGAISDLIVYCRNNLWPRIVNVYIMWERSQNRSYVIW